MDQNYIVIAITCGERHFGCQVIPEDAIYVSIYSKVYGPGAYMDCFEWVGFNCSRIDPWWEEEKKRVLDLLGDRKSVQAYLAPTSNRKIEIASLRGVPEFKIEWEGDIIKYPVPYTRTSKLVAYAEFSAPDDLMRRFWGDIARCATGAAVAAGVTAILGSPAAALPAFKAAFVACISGVVGDRVGQISVGLSTRQEHGEWSRV